MTYLFVFFLLKDSFASEINELSSNITFIGDYDQLNASNELELKRTMIHNYLLSIGMPLISDIVLMKGIDFLIY